MIRQLALTDFATNDLSRIIDFNVNKPGIRVNINPDNAQSQPFVISLILANQHFWSVRSGHGG